MGSPLLLRRLFLLHQASKVRDTCWLLLSRQSLTSPSLLCPCLNCPSPSPSQRTLRAAQVIGYFSIPLLYWLQNSTARLRTSISITTFHALLKSLTFSLVNLFFGTITAIEGIPNTASWHQTAFEGILVCILECKGLNVLASCWKSMLSQS